MIHFTSFLPNVAYAKGLLPSIYLASAVRAREMAVRLMKHDWDAAAFSLRRSAMGRMRDRLKGR